MEGQQPPITPPPMNTPGVAPQKPKTNTALIVIVAVVGSCCLLGVLTSLFGDSDADSGEGGASGISSTGPSGSEPVAVAPEPDPKVEYMERIELEIDSISKYKTTISDDAEVDEVVVIGAIFPVWGGYVHEAQKYDLTEEELARVRKLASEIKRVQRRDLPKIRKAYGEALDRRLWEFDIDVATRGSRSTTLEFIGAMFAANRNIKEWNDEKYTDWQAMRFKRTQYKWISSAGATYYDYEGVSDDYLIALDSGTFVKVEVP